MKPLNTTYKKLLTDFSKNLQTEVLKYIHDKRVIIKDIVVESTETFGWMTNILHIKNIPGKLQLWLDMYPNVGRPVLALCYSTSAIERIKKIAVAFTLSEYSPPDFSARNLTPRDPSGRILNNPLAKKYFNYPVIESYHSKYLTFFLSESVHQNNDKLKRKCLKLSLRLIRAMASVLEAEQNNRRDYAHENRKVVVKHLRRERSSKLSLIVKTRDGFLCQICDFSFLHVYGEIGRGFAEAHHIIPLSKLRNSTHTYKEDMITVCSNCHRMLHHMSGLPSDIIQLRKLIKKRIP